MRERNPLQTLVYSVFLGAPIAVGIQSWFIAFGDHMCDLLAQSEFIQGKSINAENFADICSRYAVKAAGSYFIGSWIACTVILFILYEVFIFSANETPWPPRR